MDIFSSIKEINRLLSKGMLNIYLKVTIEKKVPCFLLSKNKKKRNGLQKAWCKSGTRTPESGDPGPGTPLKVLKWDPGHP